MRAFFAVELDAAAREAAADVQQQLRRAHDARAVRWVDPANFHVTLRFLGNVEADGIGPLAATVAESLAEPKARDILSRNVYGWFDRPAVGLYELSPRGEREIPLTRRELDVLGLFAAERGRIVSRRALLQEVWGVANADRIETRTVDMHIAKLRKKLGARRDLIETVRGEGYRLAS